MISKNARWGAVALAVLAAVAVSAAPALVAPAWAQSSFAAEKAVVDAAKSRGDVGEQADGYLGLVHGSAGDPAVADAVAKINGARGQAYREAAAKTGVTAEAAAAAGGKLLVSRVAAGQYYRTAGGDWVRK